MGGERDHGVFLWPLHRAGDEPWESLGMELIDAADGGADGSGGQRALNDELERWHGLIDEAEWMALN